MVKEVSSLSNKRLKRKQNDYKVKFVSAETRDISGLTIRKDKTLYVLLLGGIIFMIGVAQGAYWNHRRIWIQKGTGNELLIAGHTNKNWFKLKQGTGSSERLCSIYLPIQIGKTRKLFWKIRKGTNHNGTCSVKR